MSDDVVERAKAAMEQTRLEILAAENFDIPLPLAEALAGLFRDVIPDLVVEVEKLRRQPGCCCGGCVL